MERPQRFPSGPINTYLTIKFKLNKDAIMKAVNCSSRTFREVTQQTRDDLVEARDFAIESLAEKGVSQREIASRVGMTHVGVAKVLEREGGKNCHNGESYQSKNEQPEVSPEETP